MIVDIAKRFADVPGRTQLKIFRVQSILSDWLIWLILKRQAITVIIVKLGELGALNAGDRTHLIPLCLNNMTAQWRRGARCWHCGEQPHISQGGGDGGGGAR